MARPKVPLLNRSLVVKAALHVLDTDGLDGLSVRRLADEFGVRVGSLYHHFENKDAILRQVCQRIVLEVEPPDESVTDWAELVIRTVTGFRRVLLRHPNVIPVMLRYEPHILVPEVSERYRAMLQERGLPGDWMVPIIEAFDVMVMGSVAMHYAQMTEGNRRDVRGTASLRRADEAFEYRCRMLAEGFRSEIQRGVPAPGDRNGARVS